MTFDNQLEKDKPRDFHVFGLDSTLPISDSTKQFLEKCFDITKTNRDSKIIYHPLPESRLSPDHTSLDTYTQAAIAAEKDDGVFIPPGGVYPDYQQGTYSLRLPSSPPTQDRDLEEDFYTYLAMRGSQRTNPEFSMLLDPRHDAYVQGLLTLSVDVMQNDAISEKDKRKIVASVQIQIRSADESFMHQYFAGQNLTWSQPHVTANKYLASAPSLQIRLYSEGQGKMLYMKNGKYKVAVGRGKKIEDLNWT